MEKVEEVVRQRLAGSWLLLGRQSGQAVTGHWTLTDQEPEIQTEGDNIPGGNSYVQRPWGGNRGSVFRSDREGHAAG